MYYLIEILEKPFNLLYSFFIFLSIGIWFLSFLGFSKDISSHSIDVSSSDSDTGTNFLGNIFNFGALPLGIWLTLLLIFTGIIGITLNELTLGFFSANIGKFSVIIINFILSFLASNKIVKVISKPLSLLFKEYGVVLEADNLVGKVAKVSSGKVTNILGQATIEIEGQDITLAVRTEENTFGFEIVYGQKVLLTHFDKEKNVYWCEPTF